MEGIATKSKVCWNSVQPICMHVYVYTLEFYSFIARLFTHLRAQTTNIS